jgi:hypothetical protein
VADFRAVRDVLRSLVARAATAASDDLMAPRRLVV